MRWAGGLGPVVAATRSPTMLSCPVLSINTTQPHTPPLLPGLRLRLTSHQHTHHLCCLSACLPAPSPAPHLVRLVVRPGQHVAVADDGEAGQGRALRLRHVAHVVPVRQPRVPALKGQGKGVGGYVGGWYVCVWGGGGMWGIGVLLVAGWLVGFGMGGGCRKGLVCGFNKRKKGRWGVALVAKRKNGTACQITYYLHITHTHIDNRTHRCCRERPWTKTAPT